MAHESIGNEELRPAALAGRVAEHEAYLRAFVRASLSPALRESVSDIVQSTIRQVLATPGRFVYRSEDEFRAWLRQAARNKIRNKIRGKHQDETPDPEHAPERHDSGPGPLDRALRAEELERLGAALDELPEDDAQLIRLHRILGLSLDEIAEVRSQPSSTLSSRIQRIMTVLASRMRPLA